MAEDQFAQLFRNLSDQIGNLTISGLVPIYNGEPAKFNDWVKSIDKCTIVNGLSEDKKTRLAYRFSNGIVSDFLARYLSDNPEVTWEATKGELSRRFGQVSDPYLERCQRQPLTE